MTIASLVTAVAYLLLLLVGAVGALLVLVWLFEETQPGAKTERETVKRLRNTKVGEGNGPLARAEIKLPEDMAA